MLTCIGVLISYFGVNLALVSRDVIDVATHRTEGNLIHESVRLGLLIILQLLFQIFSSTIGVYVTGNLNVSFKRRLFSSLLYKDWKSVSKYHSVELLNRINDDINIITTAVVGIIPN
ncbi:MAG: hypothetical protein GX046_07545, partial [Tissierellia bacterium]|nr:hypothetical protein [Tissierellia bacterium]